MNQDFNNIYQKTIQSESLREKMSYADITHRYVQLSVLNKFFLYTKYDEVCGVTVFTELTLVHLL